MSSWNKQIVLIIFLLILGLLPRVCWAIEEVPYDVPSDVPTMNESGGVDIPVGKESKKKKEHAGVDILSDNIDYFPDEKKIVATGNASIMVQGHETKLKADKITMYQELNEIFAEGNVKIIKKDVTMVGDYIRIDLNKESVLINQPKTEVGNIRLVAKEGYVYADDLEAVKGTANITEEMHYRLASSAFGTGFEGEDLKELEEYTKTIEYKKKIKNKVYKIKTKEIELLSGKERHFIKMKNASIYKGKFKIATAPTIVMSSSKSFSEVETMLPEFGQTDQSGAYFGPAALFNLPFATSLKVAPLVLKDGDEWGYGGFARIKNSKNKTEFMYGNATNNAILKGEQELWHPNLKLRYSKNAYISDGFMGDKLPGHFVELQYVADETIDDIGLRYMSLYSIGVASDSAEDRRIKQMKHDAGWSTLRMKTQGKIMKSKPIYSYKDILKFNIMGQYDFTQYGTGENAAVVRVGPTLMYTGKDLRTRIGYSVSGVHGEKNSPFVWDNYYYGRQSINLGSEYKFNDKISLGLSNVIVLNKDNYDGRLFAENKFYAKIGPDDFKFCFAYDTVRRRTMMGLNLLVGSENSDIEFDKFKVKDYKNLEKDKEKEQL